MAGEWSMLRERPASGTRRTLSGIGVLYTDWDDELRPVACALADREVAGKKVYPEVRHPVTTPPARVSPHKEGPNRSRQRRSEKRASCGAIYGTRAMCGSPFRASPATLRASHDEQQGRIVCS